MAVKNLQQADQQDKHSFIAILFSSQPKATPARLLKIVQDKNKWSVMPKQLDMHEFDNSKTQLTGCTVLADGSVLVALLRVFIFMPADL